MRYRGKQAHRQPRCLCQRLQRQQRPDARLFTVAQCFRELVKLGLGQHFITQVWLNQEAQIEIDQVNVNTAQHQLDGATLTAPIDGVVSQVNIKAGQTASGGGTSSSATSAVVIYSPGAYQVTGTVSDAQVNLVAIGQTAEVTPAGSTRMTCGPSVAARRVGWSRT